MDGQVHALSLTTQSSIKSRTQSKSAFLSDLKRVLSIDLRVINSRKGLLIENDLLCIGIVSLQMVKENSSVLGLYSWLITLLYHHTRADYLCYVE